MNITNLANQALLERVYNANAERVLLDHEETSSYEELQKLAWLCVLKQMLTLVFSTV